MRKLLLSLAAICSGIAAMAACPVEYQGTFTFGSSFGNLSTTIDGTKYSSDKMVYIPEIETVQGALIGKHFFIGAGTGFKYQIGTGSFQAQIGYVPLFAELKGVCPVSATIAPYVMVDLGYGFCTYINRNKSYIMDNMTVPGGFCAKAGLGIDINRFLIALGYSYQGMTVKSANVGYNEKYDWGTNAFFIKIGVAF